MMIAQSCSLLCILTMFTSSPTVSGTLAEAVGWRAIMWLCVTVASVIEILFITLFRETYHPTILKRRAAKKREETGDDSYATEYEEQDKGLTSTLGQSMARPLRIVWSSSMLQCMCLWGGIMFAFFYVNSTTMPEILEVIYGFSPSKRGLSYLAWSKCWNFSPFVQSLHSPGSGSVIGIFTCNRTMDKIYKKLGKRHGKHYPEGRLPLLLVGTFLLPVAVTLYGWIAQAHAPVPVFLATVTLLCVSFVFSLIPLITFVTDAFGRYSASAMTSVLVVRCLMGAFLPLIVPPLVEKVGYGRGLTILAAVALVLAPVPCLVMRYGPIWRQRSEYTKDE